MPPDAQVSEIESDIWRLQEFSKLSHLQKEKLSATNLRREVPLSAIPCHSEFLRLISKIAAKKDDLWLFFNTYEHNGHKYSQSVVIKEIKSALRMHGTQLSEAAISDCLEAIKLFSRETDKVQVFQSSSQEQSKSCKFQTLRDNLDLIDLHLQTSSFSYGGLQQSNNQFERYQVQVLSKLAVELITNQELCQRFSVEDDSFVKKFLQKRETCIVSTEGFENVNFKELVQDPRNAIDIAMAKLGFDEDSLYTQAQMIELHEVACDLLWCKKITDFKSFQKAVIISLRALSILTRQKQIESNKVAFKSDKFIPQAFQLLRATEDEQVAHLVFNLLSSRMSHSRFAEQDMLYYLGQIESNEDAAENSELVEYTAQGSCLYQLLEQIMSVRCKQREEEDMSAFEAPVIDRSIESGILQKGLAGNPKIQHVIYNFLGLCQSGPSQALLKSPKNKFFRKKWHELIIKTLMVEPTKTGDSFVVPQTISMIVKILSADKNKFTEVENQALQQQIEQLVVIWTSRLTNSVYCLQEREGIVQLDSHQKSAIITLLLRFFVNKNSASRDTDWGARISEGKLLTTLQEHTLPLIGKPDQEHLNPLLMAYVYLISEMIDNEIHLIRALLKPGDDQTGVINQILAVLKVWQPSLQRSTQMLPNMDYFRIITRFLGRLSLTEQGCNAVIRNGPKIVQQILNISRNFQNSIRIEMSEFFEIDASTERLFQIEPINLVIRAMFSDCVKEAQQIADKLSSKYQEYLDDNKQSKRTANYLIQKHITEICRLHTCLRCFWIKDQRLKRRDQELMPVHLEQTLTKLFRQPDNHEPVLKQRQDLITLMETLVTIDWPVTPLVNVIRTLISEASSVSVPGQPCQSTAVIEKCIKDSISEFTEATNLLNSQESFDQLNCKDHRKKLCKLLLYTQNAFLPKERNQIRNWKDQIAPIMHIALLLCHKWFDMTVKQAVDPESGAMTSQSHYRSVTKALKVTDAMESYVPLIKALEKLHTYNRKLTASEYGMKSSQHEEFPFAILHQIQMIASVPVPEDRNMFGLNYDEATKDKTEDKNTLLAMGECLAEFSRKLKTEAPDQVDGNMLAWCGHNESYLQILNVMMMQEKQLTGPLHLAFIYKNGITQVCKLYRTILKLQTQLFNSVYEPMATSETDKNMRTVIKALILAQKEVLVRLLINFICLKEKRPRVVQQYHQVKVAEYTGNKFKSVKHLLLNQYHQMFSELLNWDKDSNDEDSLALDNRQPNYDGLIESLLKAYSNQSWKNLEKNEDTSYEPRYRRFHDGIPPDRFDRERERADRGFSNNLRRQQPQIDQNREVTADELRHVTDLGYDEVMATNAIRMARFNTREAIEILLTNEAGLLEYIEQQNSIKKAKEQELESSELIEAMKMSIEDVDMKLPQNVQLSVEEFETCIKNYQSRALSLMLQTTDKTVVDQECALKIIRKLAGTMHKKDTWAVLFKHLSECNQDQFCYQAHLLKVILVFMQQSKPELAQMTPMTSIVERAKAWLDNLDEKYAQDALYYLCLYLHKTVDFDGYLDDETSSLSLQILESKTVQNLTKDLVLITVYHLLTKKSSNDSSVKALQYVKSCEESGGMISDASFLGQIQRIALYSKPSAQRTLEEVLIQSFLAMNLYKNDLIKKIVDKDKTKVEKLESNTLAQYQYSEMMKQLLLVTQDVTLIKEVLEKKSIIFKLKPSGPVLIKPQLSVLTEAIEINTSADARIKLIKQDEKVFNEELVEADRVFTEQVQPNERQIFELILASVKSSKGNPQKVRQSMEKQMVIIAKWTKVYPHLLCLLKMPTYKDFANWFIFTLCAEMCTREETDPLGITKQIAASPVNFAQNLSDVLCSLLGTNQFTLPDEYSLRYNLKIQMINVATRQLRNRSDSERPKTLASMEVLRCLCKFQNSLEFNRVLLAPRYYYDSLEYIVLHTDFLKTVSELVNSMASSYSWSQTRAEDDEILQLTFDCVQTLCTYAELHQKEETKSQETKNIMSPLYRKFDENKPIAQAVQDQPMVEQPAVVQNAPAEAVSEAMVVDQQNNQGVEVEVNNDPLAEVEVEVEPEERDDSSNEDEEDNDDEEEIIDDYDQEEGFEEGEHDQSSSYYDEEADDVLDFHQRGGALGQGIVMQSNDIIRRPRESGVGIGAAARGWGDPLEMRFREPVPAPFTRALLHGHVGAGLADAQQNTFSEAWTQQEHIAQNLLHSLVMDENADQAPAASMRVNIGQNTSPCFRCLAPGHRADQCPLAFRDRQQAAVPQGDINSRQKEPALNRFSQRFDVLRSIDKLDIFKLLQDNIKKFQGQSSKDNKKEPPLQFRTPARPDPRTEYLHPSAMLRSQLREVIDLGGENTIEERLRVMEAHMRMLIEGEGRNDERFFQHVSDREIGDPRDELPVDLIGGSSLNADPALSQVTLSETLLQQLQAGGAIQAPPESAQPEAAQPSWLHRNPFQMQYPNEQSRVVPPPGYICPLCNGTGHLRTNCPTVLRPQLGSRMLPQGINDELPSLFDSIQLAQPPLADQGGLFGNGPILPALPHQMPDVLLAESILQQRQPPQEQPQQVVEAQRAQPAEEEGKQADPRQGEDESRSLTSIFSRIDEESVHEEEEAQPQQPMLIEEQQPQPQAQQAEQMTFGYPNSVLLQNDIDPEILHDLPEDVRVELLSTINWMALPPAQPQPEAVQVPVAQQQPPQQQPAQQQQADAAENRPAEEAKDIGIDQDFLANLPEEIRQEILMNERLRNQNLGRSQQPTNPDRAQQRQQSDTDVAALIAQVTDPQLRVEMLLNLDPAAVAALPENLRLEANRAQQQARTERQRQRMQIQRLFQPQADAPPQVEPFRGGGMFGRDPLDGRFGGNPFMNGPRSIFDRPPPDHMFGPRADFDRNPFGAFEMHHWMDEPDQRRASELDGFGRRQKVDSIKTIEDVELLHLSVDQCFFKFVNNDGLFLIKSNKSIIELIEAHLGSKDSCLLKTLLQLLIKISTMEQKPQAGSEAQKIKTRFNLVPLMNSLTQVTQNGVKTLTETLISSYEQNFQELTCENVSPVESKTRSQSQIQSLVLISTLRLLIQMNKKIAAQMLTDFMFQKSDDSKSTKNTELNVILSHLQSLSKSELKIHQDDQEDSERMKKALIRNLQQTLCEILVQYDGLPWNKKSGQTVSEATISSLTQILDLYITDPGLVHSVGKVLLKISKQKQQNLLLIVSTCRNKQNKAQKGIISGLNKALEHQEVEIDDNASQASHALSLQYQMSQQSQQQAAADAKPGKMSKDEMKQLETILSDTQKDLTCLRHIAQIFALFKGTATEKLLQEDKKNGNKNQVHILNQVLSGLKNQKNLKGPILSVLRSHVGCIFEVNQAELTKIVSQFDAMKKTQSIKMQPVNAENSVQSNKQKLSAAVLKNAAEISDQLYEFCKFCLINKDIINKMVTMPPSYQSTCSLTLSAFVKAMPNILNFENKRSYFRREIDKLKRDQRASGLRLSVRRKDIFMEAYAQLGHKSASEMKGTMHVDFIGEKGADAGGLTRDFFIDLSRAMFNPNYSLFKLTSNGVTYYPNDQSFVNPDHLNFFKFIGRIIGKALFDGHLLECYFSKPLYKMMVGDDLLFEDQQDLDDDAYRGYKWTMDNDPSEQGMYFCIDLDYFGKHEQKDLIPGGSETLVTNENKLDYLEKLGYFKMYTMIKEQVDSFLKGFHEMIPKQLVQIFSHQELELLISGLPDFNLNDLRANTEYQGGYDADSPQVRWLWQILAQASKEEIGKFLQFVTGSSRIPLEGFKALQGMRGPQAFTITRIRDTTKLPMGHTCFNQIDMPEYPTQEMLKEKLLFAIMETSGFGFA